MTTQPSRNLAPVRVSRPAGRPSGQSRRGVLGLLLLPIVLLAAAVSPRQMRLLADAESID